MYYKVKLVYLELKNNNMNQEPINPGCINKIYPLSEKTIGINRSEMMNGEMEDKGLKIIYEVDCNPDYIKINTTIKYVKIGNDGYELYPFSFFRGFSLYKITEMNAGDLFIISDYCLGILNEELNQLSPPLKGVPAVFHSPYNKDNYKSEADEDLDKAVDQINACDKPENP